MVTSRREPRRSPPPLALARRRMRGLWSPDPHGLRVLMTRIAGLAVAAGLRRQRSRPTRSAAPAWSSPTSCGPGVCTSATSTAPRWPSAVAPRPVPPALGPPAAAPRDEARRVRLRDAQPRPARRGAPRRARADAAAGPPRFLVRVDEFPLAGRLRGERARRGRLRSLPLDPGRGRRALPDRRQPGAWRATTWTRRRPYEPPAVRPRAGDARRGCAGTAWRSRCTASTTAPATPAPGTAPSWSGWATAS